VDRWESRRLDTLVVDHLLREGRIDAAEALARDAGVERLADTEIFRQRGRIVERLREHSTAEALAWCADHRSRLKKVDSDLEFHLHLQNFIELVRAGDTAAAVAEARANLAPHAAEKPLEVQRAMGSLAFGAESARRTGPCLAPRGGRPSRPGSAATTARCTP
jgi:macrophage erythroblast attacher